MFDLFGSSVEPIQKCTLHYSITVIMSRVVIGIFLTAPAEFMTTYTLEYTKKKENKMNGELFTVGVVICLIILWIVPMLSLGNVEG